MISHLESHKFNSLLGHFNNASLVNQKGELLFSKDADPFKTTTSRLVLFQTSKKYLSPKPGDLIMTNDPENGGTSLNRLYFISCLDPNLFLVWDSEFHPIDFKIPLLPLIEAGVVNSAIWSALVESQTFKDDFSLFLKKEFQHLERIKQFKVFIKNISQDIFQKNWFSVCKNIFKTHFETKALGQNEVLYKYKEIVPIKLNTLIDEKQDIKQIQLDFSGTKPFDAQSQFSCASHVIESGLIIELIKFYGLERYLSQPFIDHVKLIMPPRSVITTAHKAGEFNFELQKIVRQLMRFNLNLINAQSKKTDKKFSLYSTHSLRITKGTSTCSIFLSNSRIEFKNLEYFIQKKLNNHDSEYSASLILPPGENGALHVHGVTSTEDHTKRWIKLNQQIITHGQFTIKPGDELSFYWNFSR